MGPPGNKRLWPRICTVDGNQDERFADPPDTQQPNKASQNKCVRGWVSQKEQGDINISIRPSFLAAQSQTGQGSCLTQKGISPIEFSFRL